MPVQPLDRGHMMNLGAGIVPGNITLNGVGANYSIAIGGGAPIVGVAAVGHPVVYPINLATVHLTNTTAAAGPSNLMVSW